MYKLYGFPVSNYYNMVKLALLEKGLDFEEVITRPSQEESYLAKSPMGKIPCLEVKEGPISETNVILDYLEEVSGDRPFYPEDAFQRAKVRELMKATELYLELVARRLLGGALFGQEMSEALKDEVRGQLDKGCAALNKLLRFSPYAAGETFTYADFMLYYTVTLANIVTQKALDVSLEDKLPGLADWLALTEQNAHILSINGERDAALKAMIG